MTATKNTKIAVLGTGGGGRTHAARLAELGYEVHVGTRDPEATLARTEPDMMGNAPYKVWLAANPGIQLHTFADAAAAADEIVINGIDGHNAVAALTAIADQLTGKTLIDYPSPTSTAPRWSTPGPPRGARCPSWTPATPTASPSRSSAPCRT
ncbi:NAD(P)-binding domain-containing protein [Streptomyces sp. NPDC097981]|uniref:NAD(P)-binding domain-containing protein n=1 Tax=Streptomyces sp. NPDC097981 TaxID=3155428 RepID=UPI003325BF0A